MNLAFFYSKNHYVLAKIGADRAENGQHLAEILSPNQRLVLRGSSWGICHAPTNDLFYVARLGVSATLQLTTSFTWLVLEYLPRSNQRLLLRGSSWSICHGLVLGCIDADFCKKIRVLQHFSKSTKLSS